jgi:UDP-N-acetylglucosamine--N-acetylmuramyl-(pentapeptide) pyrophosphoryl-undecaprenol N-acetylglucosamine transferase
VTVFAVVTGGGTAGHVFPAMAVADSLVATGRERAAIHYVGTERGVETTLLPPTGYPHTLLDVVGLQRTLTWRNVAFAPKMLAATARARRLLLRLDPRVVVSVGGYGAMPTVFAARLLHIPIVVVSYDRRPGRANALAARFAAACAVAFPGSSLPRAEMTGAPVRQAVLDVDRAAGRDAARRALGLPTDRFVVTVTGGSLGSAAINAAVAGYVAAHRDDVGLAVRHVVGRRFIAGVALGDGSTGVLYQVLAFDEELALSYAATDMFVGRGGASTVAEVAAAGVPAVLVPWSGAADDHQTANVRWLADQGAAVQLAEDELARIGDVIEQLRADGDRRRTLEQRARRAGEVHRSGALPALIERVALP